MPSEGELHFSKGFVVKCSVYVSEPFGSKSAALKYLRGLKKFGACHHPHVIVPVQVTDEYRAGRWRFLRAQTIKEAS